MRMGRAIPSARLLDRDFGRCSLSSLLNHPETRLGCILDGVARGRSELELPRRLDGYGASFGIQGTQGGHHRQQLRVPSAYYESPEAILIRLVT
jgi:hypothetical protein